MNSELRQFVSKYLAIVFSTLMLVSFFAFLAIPYGLGGHPGDEDMAQQAVPVPTQSADQTSQAKAG